MPCQDDVWKFSLEAFAIESGTYANFSKGQLCSFPVEITIRHPKIASERQACRATRIHHSQYAIVGRVETLTKKMCAINIGGIICVQVHEIPRDIKVSDYLVVDAYLGVYPYEWRNQGQEAGLAYVYDWRIEEIKRLAAPMIEVVVNDVERLRLRDRTRWQYEAVESTEVGLDARRGDEYLIGCRLLSRAKA